MNMTSYFVDQIRNRFDGTYQLGSYEALKAKYPERLAEIEEELNNNFTHESIDKYLNSIQAGLKKIGYYKD